MAKRKGLPPEQRLAHNLSVANEASGSPSYRKLRDEVAEIVGDDSSVSHEQIRKLHLGLLSWKMIIRNRYVVDALAQVYGVRVADLSPELAASTPPGTRTRNLQIVAQRTRCTFLPRTVVVETHCVP